MTNKEGDGEPSCDPRLAALLAVHLVSQVLDEAYVIASAAKDSGQPWRHLSMLNNFKSGLSEIDDEDVSLVASKGDSRVVNENKTDVVANMVATSTPQKVSGDGLRNSNSEVNFFGQGDEEMRQAEITKSTSMFLNHLFDMSEVERVDICDDTNAVQANNEPSDLLTRAMTKIMESYINTALGIAYDQNVPSDAIEVPNEASSNEHSEYSFLADAFAVDVGGDIAFYIHDDVNNNEAATVEISEINEPNPEELNIEKINVARYEHAFLTLNRDYEQCSDDDCDPILHDPKGMTLQEVELLTANTSDDNSINHESEEHSKQKPEKLAATSAVSAAASGSRKSSLVSRCRSQGARLLSCIRGWWRRKTPGKRKEAQVSCSIRGMCPLSPDARRRAASLMDQRLLRSPSPSRPVVWKFNTVNEALVKSSHWKDYTFETQPDERGEY